MGRRRKRAMKAKDSPSSSIDSSSTDLNMISTTCSHDMKGRPTSLFVKVYMEGIPIGRKLDLMAHYGYHDLIKSLHLMFNCKTTILWAERDEEGLDWEKCRRCVLTYQDLEGDWLMVGDVPWEMFLRCCQEIEDYSNRQMTE